MRRIGVGSIYINGVTSDPYAIRSLNVTATSGNITISGI